MTRPADPLPERKAGQKDPDPAPRAPAEEADKRDDFAVKDGKQVEDTAKNVGRSRATPPASQEEQGYGAAQDSERARAGAGKEAERAPRSATPRKDHPHAQKRP